MYRYCCPLALWFTLVVLSFVTAAVAATAKVLIYSATAGFRHDSIPTAVKALQDHGNSAGVVFDATQDEGRFRDETLAEYDGIVFLSNTGEVLSDEGKKAFQNYLNLGGNFIGIHSATDALLNTTFFQKEIGAYFDYHPELSNATVTVIDNTHPSTSMLPKQWHVKDEMYNFKSNPRDNGVTVVLSADESSYSDPGPRNYNQGTPHPTAWFADRGQGATDPSKAGRMFYTSLGHLNETWADDLFLSHVLGGITWTLQSNTTLAYNASGKVGNPQGTQSSPSTAMSTSVSSRASVATPSQSNSALITAKIPPSTLLALSMAPLALLSV